MINFIWAAMLVIGFAVGTLNGNIDGVTNALIDNATRAVELGIGLIGIMALWLGIMKIAEESGLTKGISRILKPIMIKLFPDVPPEHPAMGSMIMNISANILGLGNAATPFGLKAMEELQKLNKNKDTATNAMVTFLAINTSSVTLIPASTIAILGAAGARNPTEIIGPTIIATSISTIVAVIVAKTLEKSPKYKINGVKPRKGRKIRWYSK